MSILYLYHADCLDIHTAELPVKKKPATLRCGLKSKPFEVLEETSDILLQCSKLSRSIFVYRIFLEYIT